MSNARRDQSKLIDLIGVLITELHESGSISNETIIRCDRLLTKAMSLLVKDMKKKSDTADLIQNVNTISDSLNSTSESLVRIETCLKDTAATFSEFERGRLNQIECHFQSIDKSLNTIPSMMKAELMRINDAESAANKSFFASIGAMVSEIPNIIKEELKRIKDEDMAKEKFYIDSLSASLDLLSNKAKFELAHLKDEDTFIFKNIKNDISIIEDKCQMLQILMNTCKTFLYEIRTKLYDTAPKQYRYNNDYERGVVAPFYKMFDRPDFDKVFIDFVRDMDQEDIQTVTRIIIRQKLIRGHEGEAQDLYSTEEKQELRRMDQHFRQAIFDINDHLFCYKNYFLPIRHFEPCVFWDCHGLSRIKHIEYTRERDIIDAGGFIGDSCLILSPLTHKKVYTFEAVEKNYVLMQETLKLNNLTNVVPIHAALSNTPGTLDINVASASSSIFETPIPSESVEHVDAITLDQFVEKNELNVGLIKIDVEGSESLCLEGAMNIIKSQQPIMLVSIYHNPHDFFFLKPMIEKMGVKYHYSVHKPVDHSISREVLLICEPYYGVF